MADRRFGKYRIVDIIGRGGMADVYKALHPDLNRVVALKVLNRALLHSPEMLERFHREARAIAGLQHPNIVQVFDLDVVDGVYFMVMEYVEGETLSQRLTYLEQRGQKMPLREVLYIISALGRALHYAHERGLLHRDIKPANVMFRGDGSPVLTDFGVAKIIDASSQITATGAVAGTPAYMAPEQWTDDEPDKRSDIYSLGVVLYQIVTGELPFSAKTPGRLMFKHISESPPLPRTLRDDIPLELERVILRAMAKNPQDRYQSAQELVQELRDVVYQVESTAPTPRPGVLRRPSRREIEGLPGALGLTKTFSRSPWFWLGAGAIITLIVIVGLFAGGFVGSATPSSPSSTPDVTGTALAIRLTALEATLSVSSTPPPTLSPTPSPTFFFTPTPDVPTKTTIPVEMPKPPSSPSPSPTPDACVLAMTLLQDVNYFSADWWSTVNAQFDKVWQLRNDGDCPWPQSMVLVHLDGQDFGLEEPFPVDALPVGEEIELSVSLQAPSTAGQYEGRFQLQTSTGEPVGEPLAVKLETRPRTSLTPTVVGALEPVRLESFELIECQDDDVRKVWRGKVRLFASGGTGQYTWYRDTLDNPLPGDVLEFEWGIGRDFFGSVWIVSGDMVGHQGLHVPYPGSCQ